MSGNPINLVASPQTPTTAKMLKPDGSLEWAWFKYFIDTTQALNNALNILGQFNGVIGTGATVTGHAGTLASTIQHLTPSGQLIASELTGLIAPAQLPAADPITQGAVILPAGAPSNVLDTAAFQPTSAFDAAGDAAAAQTNAFAHSDAGDVTTLASAKAYTDGKFPGVTAHTIALAKITLGGADGSLTWDANGVITGFVDPT